MNAAAGAVKCLTSPPGREATASSLRRPAFPPKLPPSNRETTGMKQLLSIVAAGLVLAACGGGGDSEREAVRISTPAMKLPNDVKVAIMVENKSTLLKLPNKAIEDAEAAGFARNRGWGAAKYADEDADLAVVYSNVEDPKDETTVYSSYGWWVRRVGDGPIVFAGAFSFNSGSVSDDTDIGTLQGKATYTGGAAGLYWLYSTNPREAVDEAAPFTARATLHADFERDAISGTVDLFIGADGEARNWEVELKESAIGNTGTISRTGADDDAGAETVWTIEGMAATASGEWGGHIQHHGDNDVASGTFYSRHGTASRMVGAFGADKQ